MKAKKLGTPAEIGTLIRAKREEQGLSQTELAGVSMTGQRFISDLENGKRTVQIGKLLSVVNALGLGVHIFSRWEDDD